jgi:hypothetical protein
MRAPYGWTKAARRGSAYYAQGGFWIFKTGSQWELVRRISFPSGWESFGKFPTMSAAADYYNRATIHGGAA